MRVTLKITLSTQSPAVPAAWLVMGRDPRAWLAELSRWPVPLLSLAVRIVPVSPFDLTPMGLFVTTEGGTATTDAGLGAIRTLESLATPYRCVAGRVFLPVDAMIVPPVDDAELIAQLPTDDSEFVWHPSVGLVRFEKNDRLRVVDLIAPRARTESRWDRAVTGISFRSRLVSVEPEESPSVEQILKSAAEGIGSKAKSLDDLPPTPDERLGGKLYDWTKPLRNAWKALRERFKPKPQPPKTPPPASDSPSRPPGGLFGGLGEMFGSLIASVAGPLAGIAASGAAAMSQLIPQSFVDQAKRLREIDRLLSLLKNDPDAGLRYALPMGGTAEPRGIGHSGNELVSRDVNFGLGSLFGSSAVDPWDVPPNQQFQLLQMYRDLALREVRLDRHRRAAYIYAELLGDLQGAAQALEAGHHYREAAVLYRDRLNRPVEAARCLEQGGLLDEAAQMYIELKMIDKAAELYLRLERPDEAHRLWREWAGQLQREGQFQSASEVWHGKLNDVDKALSVLEVGWNQNGPQASACMTQQFKILAEHGRHDDASKKIAGFRSRHATEPRPAMVVNILARVANSYVDRTVRDEAADATRVIAAGRLRHGHTAELQQILESIRSLAPQDRLLARDCDRFGTQRNAVTPVKNLKTAENVKNVARTMAPIPFVREFSLQDVYPDTAWVAAKSNSQSLYAVGHHSNGLVLFRYPWTDLERTVVVFPNVSDVQKILFDVPENGARQVLLHDEGAESLALQRFSLADGFELAGSPTWVTPSTLAFAYCDGGVSAWRIRHFAGSIELSCFNSKGDEVTTGTLRSMIEPEILESVSITICASAKPIRIGIGNVICRPLFREVPAGNDDPPSVAGEGDFIDVESEILSLHNYRDRNVDCVVALFETGGVMIREPIHQNYPQRFAEDVVSPQGAFLEGGRFVVAGENLYQVFRFEEDTIRKIGEVALDKPAVSVVRKKDTLSEFAILSRDGTVRIYSAPA